MRIPVIVNGAHGKMGHLACQMLEKNTEFELVAQLGSQDHLSTAIEKTNARIVIDLTCATCVFTNALTIIEHNVHPVIGTSGLQDEQIKKLHTLCAEQQLGGIIAPNFSVGAVLMMHFAQQAARFFPEVEIIEAHHRQKLDAPSGTAIKTADLIAHARRINPSTHTERLILEGARGASYNDIPIHSVRLPGILAQQQVIFGGQGETLTLTHNSLDRSCFMPGILLACQKVMHLNELHYGLEHIMQFC